MIRITDAERKLVHQHMKCCTRINDSSICETWRDGEGYLCVRYAIGDWTEWYHYDPKAGEWW